MDFVDGSYLAAVPWSAACARALVRGLPPTGGCAWGPDAGTRPRLDLGPGGERGGTDAGRGHPGPAAGRGPPGPRDHGHRRRPGAAGPAPARLGPGHRADHRGRLPPGRPPGAGPLPAPPAGRPSSAWKRRSGPTCCGFWRPGASPPASSTAGSPSAASPGPRLDGPGGFAPEPGGGPGRGLAAGLPPAGGAPGGPGRQSQGRSAGAQAPASRLGALARGLDGLPGPGGRQHGGNREELVLAAWARARAAHPGLRLVLAPRQPRRFQPVAGAAGGQVPAVPAGSGDLAGRPGALGRHRHPAAGHPGRTGRRLRRRHPGPGGRRLGLARRAQSPGTGGWGLPTLLGPGFANFEDLVAPLLAAGWCRWWRSGRLAERSPRPGPGALRPGAQGRTGRCPRGLSGALEKTWEIVTNIPARPGRVA